MVKKTIARPKNFDEFLAKDGLNENLKLKYLTSRKDWLLNESKAKAEAVIDKLPADQLPQCKGIDSEHSKVGDFFPADQFTEMFDEDGEILGNIEEGVLAYHCIDGTITWWKRRKNIKNGDDGIIRIK